MPELAPAVSGPSIWTALLGLDFAVRHVPVGPWHTRVLEAGTGEQTVVLLPGTGGHLEAYARNIRPLAERFHVVALDYPGHGYTTPATRPLELETYVTHLAGLLDQLGCRRVHLMGESLGGWVAIKFAAAHPDRVDRLVLNTPGGTMSNPRVMEQIRTLSQQAADDPSPGRIRTRLAWLMADEQSVTDELVDVRRAIYARAGFAESMRHILCLQDPQIRRRNTVTDAELAAIEQAALVVWTSDDPSGPAAAGLHIAETMPNARFELVDAAGHWPQWEQSECYNELTLAFLTGP